MTFERNVMFADFSIDQLHPIAQVVSIICGAVTFLGALYFIYKINQ